MAAVLSSDKDRKMLPEEKSPTHTPTEAKKLSLGLLLWIFVAAIAALGLYAMLRN